MSVSSAPQPTSFEEAAAALRDASARGRSVTVRGAGTKAGWGTSVADPEIELRTTALNRVLEHNAGDLTAELEAGVPVALAQEVFASRAQMLALDPALGRGGDRSATVGGMIATGDCGPLRHRYGAPRDLVLGMTVALSDGTVARSGSKVIKNVAGYDVAKLFAGSFGTLGMILSVSVRLHPLPSTTATALGSSEDPGVLQRAAIALARAPLELESLDVAWREGRGGILARVAGAEAPRRSQRVVALMRDAGLEGLDATEADDELWARQRAGQRAHDGAAMVRVSARPSELVPVIGASQAAGGTLVGRAGLGTSYVEFDPGAMARLRDALPRASALTLLDAPPELRSGEHAWPDADRPALELMRRIKRRFDPAGICNPGVFVGGI